MEFSEKQLLSLKAEVRERLSQKRFQHTEGVVRAASRIAKYCLPSDTSELEAAAYLHDIAKEYTTDELVSFIKLEGDFSDEMLRSPAVLHSFAAPYIIKRDFSEFASEKILSAVKNHTVGSHDMDVFDEIVFIADYIEDGRVYESSKQVREALYSSFREGDAENNLKNLHKATLASIDFTILSLKERNSYINSDILLTRNAFLSKI